MTLLHVYFAQKNQQAFQRQLDGVAANRGGQPQSSGGGLSISGGKSWNKPSNLTMAMSMDVNARDSLGRTVLHLACANVEPWASEFVRMLLAHPAINVNVQDTESHWTSLHRALYHGNIGAARAILSRSDIDVSLKDIEGYTAFDLYNSTIRTAKPSPLSDKALELYTWGTNRNAALGLGDGDDRAFPEQVMIQRNSHDIMISHSSLDKRFNPIGVRAIAMSRLHTAIVTSESRANVRLCGFGSGGRLGPGQHTQYSLVQLSALNHTIVAVALGQDHTLALTSAGEILSWGLNRFGQLGYVIEQPSGGVIGRTEEPVQSSPRKISSLRKDFVSGIAACKTASACWTDKEVYTWGMNSGQLGYERSAQPIQTAPRKVAKLTVPVISVSLTDGAMACLLVSKDVICFWDDRSSKINFPALAFPSEMHVYRPPQAVKDSNISKVTCCDDTFAALSSNGEVFLFVPPKPGDTTNTTTKERSFIKPQRVWALRKQFSAVKDVAVGSDGSIIICTESGHVFVRTRNVKSGSAKTHKFQRIPYIQRVISVCANSTGSFAAIRENFKATPIPMERHRFGEDLAALMPCLNSAPSPTVDISLAEASVGTVPDFFDVEDDPGDADISADLSVLQRLLAHLVPQNNEASSRLITASSYPFGADITIRTSAGFEILAHTAVLAFRCSVLSEVLSGGKAPSRDNGVSLSISWTTSKEHPPQLSISGCQPLSVLILLYYLYTDNILAPWDPRIRLLLQSRVPLLSLNFDLIKTELLQVSKYLNLPLLNQALAPVTKQDPAPSLSRDLRSFYDGLNGLAGPSSDSFANVILQLYDKEVHCNSTILRARSPFFAAFFDNPVWTEKRMDTKGITTVDLKHLKWRTVQYVLRYICCGHVEEMFESMDCISSTDELLDCMFEIMAVSSELLLDRLMQTCSAVILRFLNLQNSCNILSDASHFHANDLIRSVHGYMAANMELLLESKMLDDLPLAQLKKLAAFIREEQMAKSPISRSHRLAEAAMAKHAEWLVLEDFPEPIVRKQHSHARDSPKLSPTRNRRISEELAKTPLIRASTSRGALLGDELFEMDDELPSLNLDSNESNSALSRSIPSAGPVWKSRSVAPKMDLKSIMAEAEGGKQRVTTHSAAIAGPSARPSQLQKDWRVPKELHETTSKPSSWTITSGLASSSPNAVSRMSTSALGTTPPSNPNLPRQPSGTGLNTRPAESTPMPRVPSGKQVSPSHPSPSNLGPVFAPSKQTPKSGGSTPRRTSGTNVSAWTVPPVAPVVQSSVPIPGYAPSFVAIQQAQIDQGSSSSTKDKRSLREIQEEERAHQAEEDFMKWWAAEEERVRFEAEVIATSSATSTSATNVPRKGPRRHRPHKDKDGPVDNQRAPASVPSKSHADSLHNRQDRTTTGTRGIRKDKSNSAVAGRSSS